MITVTLSWQTILTAASVITAVGVIAAFVGKIAKKATSPQKTAEELAKLKEQHSEDIANINHELSLLTYGILACLKGLKEQGCNGPVTIAIDKFEKYLNQKAHDE